MTNLQHLDEDNLQNLWHDCFKNIEKVVDKITYETIIKNIQPKVKDPSTLQLVVQKSWQKEHLNKFIDNITGVIHEKIDPNINLSLKIGNNGNNKKVPIRTFEENKPLPQVRSEIDKSLEILKKCKIKQNYEFKKIHSSLDPRYTFENYVVGSSNRFAAAAAQAVAETPASAYNPLFIYGGVGLGKTHLIHAIGHKVLERNRDASIVYVSAEKFMNDMIESIQNKKMPSFRKKYRNVNVLLIDDIQFIKNKESTQEEFFHTFNELHAAKSQIVITSDRPPKDIPALEDRLRSRFEWGLIADISSPDLETRMAILNKKSNVENLGVPNEVINYIAEMIPSNIRELEGALNRVIGYSSLMDQPISLDLAIIALKTILPDARPKNLTIKFVQEKVCEYFNIRMEEMLGKRRESRLVIPRQIAMYLSKEIIESSYPSIGKAFGGRDHTTVMHAFKKINRELKNPTMKTDLDNIKNMLKTPGG
ncbi:MAG: chromosomal replication initiator protein DnaA [Vulcanimicrobiota bacterium]